MQGKVQEDAAHGGGLPTTPSDVLDFILDLQPVELMGLKIATLTEIRLHEANLWSRTSLGHTRLDLHHFMPEGGTDYCIPVKQPTIIPIPSKEERDA